MTGFYTSINNDSAFSEGLSKKCRSNNEMLLGIKPRAKQGRYARLVQQPVVVSRAGTAFAQLRKKLEKICITGQRSRGAESVVRHAVLGEGEYWAGV